MSESEAKQTAKAAASSSAAPKAVPRTDEERLSHQAQFSTYAPLDVPADEVQNPPSGPQVEQTPGEPHEGPVEDPLAKSGK